MQQSEPFNHELIVLATTYPTLRLNFNQSNQRHHALTVNTIRALPSFAVSA